MCDSQSGALERLRQYSTIQYNTIKYKYEYYYSGISFMELRGHNQNCMFYLLAIHTTFLTISFNRLNYVLPLNTEVLKQEWDWRFKKLSLTMFHYKGASWLIKSYGHQPLKDPHHQPKTNELVSPGSAFEYNFKRRAQLLWSIN